MNTPSTVVDGLLAAPTAIGNVRLQPLTLGLYLLLEKINSPLVKSGEQQMTPLDIFRAVYVLGTPLQESLINWQQGPEVFDAAVLGFADSIPIGEIDKLGKLIVDHIQQAFIPAAKTKSSGGSGDVQEDPLALEHPPAQA